MCASTSAVAAVWPCWCCTVLVIAHTPWQTRRKANQKKAEICLWVGHKYSSVWSAEIWEARVNASVLFAPFRRKPHSPLNRYGLFFLHKMAAVLSAAWQSSRCLCARRDGESPVPPHSRSAHRQLAVLLFWLDILPCSRTDDPPCGLKSKRSCHRNAQVSPIARVAHLTQWMCVSYQPPLTHIHPGAPQTLVGYLILFPTTISDTRLVIKWSGHKLNQ